MILKFIYIEMHTIQMWNKLARDSSGQSHRRYMSNHNREQARSHKGFVNGSSRCLKACNVTSRKLRFLASLPTATPESAGLCALEAGSIVCRSLTNQ